MSCSTKEDPKYRYAIKEIVPDTNKVKIAQWIKETMSSVSFNLKTSDYEDPEDVIEQPEETGNVLFSVKVEGIEVLKYDGGTSLYEFAAKSDLSTEELKIFEKVKKERLL